jgi:hypothetical protein
LVNKDNDHVRTVLCEAHAANRLEDFTSEGYVVKVTGPAQGCACDVCVSYLEQLHAEIQANTQ